MTQAFFEEDHSIHRRHRLTNTLHTWLLVGGSLALLAFTAWAIAGPAGIIYAVVFGAISLVAARRVGPHMVLRMYKAQQVDARSFPQGYAMMQELSQRAGLEHQPKLHIIPSKMLNAFAVGRADDSAVAITDSLVRTLTARELAGVLAHEVTHIKNEDIKVMSLADMVSRFTSTLSTIGFIAIVFNFSGFFQVSWLAVIAMVLAPTIGSVLQLALSRTREFDADYGAAMLTGDPDGLSSALAKLEQWHRRRLEAMALPVGRMSEPSMLRSHPPTKDRIARLNALKETYLAKPLKRKSGTSPVPKIKPKFGRAFLSNQADWLALAENWSPLPLPCGDADPNTPCVDYAHNAHTEDKPRIRISRGGVWW